jgi:lauroyl/myristoyl acyltransferase
VIPDLVLRTLSRVTSAIPPLARHALAKRTASIEYRTAPGKRAAVLQNLGAIGRAGHPAACGARERERVARAIFESYHRFLFEFLSHLGPGRPFPDREVRFRGMERLYAALTPGRGAVVAAPHLGNWELAGMALARLGFHVHVVTGVQLHARLTRAVRRLKERARIRVSTPEDGFAPLLGTLRAGGLVVLLADGNVFARSVPTPFFGRPVPFPIGPALLARRAKAPLLLGHSARDPVLGHVFSADEVVEPDPSLPLHDDLLRLTARVARSMERNIALHLEQWCIFRPVFRDDEAA